MSIKYLTYTYSNPFLRFFKKFFWFTPSVLFLLFVTAPWGFSSTFYVDPLNGDITNDGSFNHPWSTLRAVFDNNKIESRKPATYPYKKGDPLIPKNPGAPVKAGDTIVLRNGFHGTIFAAEYYNADYITITAQQGHIPFLGTVELRSGCKWILSGLSISPSHADTYEPNTLASFSSHGWTGPSYDCIIENCTLFSVWDATPWSLEDWNNLACNGISLAGDQMTCRNNHLKNIDFGIVVSGDFCLVENNVVENFAGDGIRGIGDYGVFQYNTVKNCYDVNANHDDGFQSWSRGDDGQVGTGTVKGIILRGNTIINYEDPSQPFRGTLQGIGCFDGMFEDWVIENNVVYVDHWHGITLSGAVNCRIVNNTVIDINTDSPGPPWIRISDHKNGSPSSGCLIRNNITTSISHDTGVMVDHNLIIEWAEYPNIFRDFVDMDFHLKSGSEAIDIGSTDLCPGVDKDGITRPWGCCCDVGAYEFFFAGLIPMLKMLLMSGID